MSLYDNVLINKIGNFGAFKFSIVSIFLSLIIVVIFSLIFHGKITYDYLVTGIVTSFLVGFTIASLLKIQQYKLEKEIIQRKKLENSLASEKELLSVTLNSIGDGVITTDNNGNIVMINAVAQEFTGWSQGEVLGKPLTEVVHVVNVDTHEVCANPVYNVLKNGEIVEHGNNRVMIAGDGTKRYISNRAAPMFNEENSVVGVVLVYHDITELKRFSEERQEMEIKMIANSKLATLGEVATGVAHEINQPLTYISSFVQNLKIDIKEGIIDKNELLEKLIVSGNQINRITAIIHHLRTFGRSNEVDKQQINIETVLDNTLVV